MTAAIWIAFAIIGALVVAGLAPVFFAKISVEEDDELETYFAQIDAIRSDTNIPEADADAAVAALQRQILAKQRANEGAEQPSHWTGGLTIGAVLLIGGLVYMSQSHPGPTIPEDVEPRMPVTSSVADAETDRNEQLRSLVAQLEERLSTDRAEDALGWRLYARSLMTLGDYDRALDAYDRAILLAEEKSELIEEKRQASEFIQARLAPNAGPIRGPSEQDVRDAEALSPEDRQSMIIGMVDGLAARLEETPDNPEGWARLIRARQVLGQTEQLRADIETVRNLYADQPELLAGIVGTADNHARVDVP